MEEEEEDKIFRGKNSWSWFQTLHAGPSSRSLKGDKKLARIFATTFFPKDAYHSIINTAKTLQLTIIRAKQLSKNNPFFSSLQYRTARKFKKFSL